MRTLILICLIAFLGSTNLNAQTPEYVGSNKCKMCHNKPADANTPSVYAHWKDSKHAKAMEVLSAAEAADPKCTKCHATAASVNKDLVTPGLKITEGVSCESCHGPGSLYFPNTIMKDRAKAIEKGMTVPSEKICKTCHNAESKHYKGFDYKEMLKKITHPKPAA